MTKAKRLAFICPRFAEGATVGGAETLLKNLALRAVADGRDVTFLTTCATDHFTWKNELPAGERTVDGMRVMFFPVDEDRDVGAFLEVQTTISRGVEVSPEEEMVWLSNSVNSKPLYEHLKENADEYDVIIAGPYMFGLIYGAAEICPEKTMLVPCLHDEPFARLKAFAGMFESVSGFIFNTIPERELAHRLFSLTSYQDDASAVVGMGIDEVDVSPTAFAQRHDITAPYLIYSGRRETAKGTPLLLDYVLAFRSRTHRDIKLVFTGSGPIEVPAGLEDHVLDLGFVSEKEKYEAMAGALAFCHPSTNESLSIVLLEAWASGTPALVNGWSDVLRFQCETSNGGLWFRNYPEFEEVLLALLKSSELREAMAASGKEYVEKEYRWEAIDGKLFAALDGR
jgi:glycosyltransferase involved in cell wall biosynthesis